MLVVNKVPWSGMDFSYPPGQVVDLPSEVAEARIREGLAQRVDDTPTEAAEPPRKRRMTRAPDKE